MEQVPLSDSLENKEVDEAKSRKIRREKIGRELESFLKEKGLSMDDTSFDSLVSFSNPDEKWNEISTTAFCIGGCGLNIKVPGSIQPKSSWPEERDYVNNCLVSWLQKQGRSIYVVDRTEEVWPEEKIIYVGGFWAENGCDWENQKFDTNRKGEEMYSGAFVMPIIKNELGTVFIDGEGIDFVKGDDGQIYRAHMKWQPFWKMPFMSESDWAYWIKGDKVDPLPPQ